MPYREQYVPKLRHHRASNQGVVTLNGRDFYLGTFGDPGTRAAYDDLITRWLSNGRQALGGGSTAIGSITLGELVVAYWEHVQGYYRHSDGQPTSELANVRTSLRPLVDLHGNTPVDQFGPLALKAVSLSASDPARDGRVKTSHLVG